jgi:phenylpropionate dioxygenase-like ring-hydroxylating dioxygenase large terminal subunit
MKALEKCWFPVAQSHELGARPLAVKLLGMPLVLFRDASGVAKALKDRCPHRLIPLSIGALENGALRCAYHGWTFDSAGQCTDIPSLPRERRLPQICVQSFRVVENLGTLWVTLHGEPFDAAPPRWIDQELDATVRAVNLDCDYVRVLENLVDNAHAAFVHKNLLRGYPRNKVQASLRETDRGLAVHTRGEQAERSLLFRLWRKATLGRDFEIVHVEEYVAPTGARVSYADRYGRLKIAVQFVCIPESEQRTKLVYRCGVHAAVGARALVPLVALSVGRLMAQDRVLLEAEARAAREDPKQPHRTQTTSDVPAVWVAKSAREFADNGPRTDNSAEPRAMDIEYLL